LGPAIVFRALLVSKLAGGVAVLAITHRRGGLQDPVSKKLEFEWVGGMILAYALP
jgi:hypothetical protein